MEIKSSLLNSKLFKHVKDSLINISKIDNEEDFRVKVIEYINDSSDEADDEYFFDMLIYTRFLHPSKNDVAFTDKNHLIWLNAPGGGNNLIGKNVRQWDFVYDHECLHQLWDTFGVADKIKKEGIEYDHQLLNIASDCVINDYLSYYRHKELPEELITPEYLHTKFNVVYDRKKDTQYTLYLKLLEKKDEIKDDDKMKELYNHQNSDNNSNKDSKEQDNQTQNNKQDKENKDNKEQDNQKQDNKQDKENKDSKEQDNTQEDSKSNSDKNEKDKEKDNEKKKGKNHDRELEDNDLDLNETDEDLEKIRNEAQQIIEKYREKISGDLGKFISQCKSSQNLKETGLVANTQKSTSMWNSKLQQYVNAYIKNKVFQKHREFKRTYQRVKRGSGFIEFGKPIERGKKIKDDKLLINAAFFVDISGSMSGCIDDVFKATYSIANALQKMFGKEKVIDKFEFDMFVFNDSINKINWGKKVRADGGNVSFDKIVKYIKEKTNTYMINIIITDAEFDINPDTTENFIKELNGMMIFVTNNKTSEMKTLAAKQTVASKLFFVQASPNFDID